MEEAFSWWTWDGNPRRVGVQTSSPPQCLSMFDEMIESVDTLVF